MSLIEEVLTKGFTLNHSPRKPVQHPGSRGGKGYYTNTGHWHYGTRPLAKPQHLLEEGDLALTITKHIEPYIQTALDNPVSPSYLRKYKEDAREVEQELSKFIPGNYTPKLIGAGGNAVAVQLSSNLVARIEREDFHEDRPNFPWMLQSIEQGHNGNLWWEVLPKVEVAVDTSTKKTYSQEGRDLLNPPPKVQNDIENLSNEAAKDGYEFSDEHAGNIGYVNGRPVIIDPGAVAHFDPEDKTLDQRAQAVESKPPVKTKEDLQTTINSNIAAVKERGYKIVDKTENSTPEEKAETWRAVNAVTEYVEQALPEIKAIMARQPLVLNVTSASSGNGVRGEHHQPLYAGAANTIDINSEYSRTFMHELGHYVDSAAAILHPSGQWDYKHKLSDLYGTPIFDAVAKLKALPEYRQWIQERPANQRGYWTRNSEVFARFFDQYMYHKLGKPPSDSYEPYTDQELEEVGKLMEDGLRKIKLIKAIINLDILSKSGWFISHERKPVKNPGSRGATQWYRNDEGVVEYGVKPQPHLHTPEQQKEDTRPKLSDVKESTLNDPTYIKFMKERAADIRKERKNITDPSSLFIHMQFDSKELSTYSDEDITKLAKLMATRAETDLNYGATYKENKGTLSDSDRAKLTKQYIAYAKRIRDIRIASPKSSDNSTFTHSVKLAEHSFDTPKEHDDTTTGSDILSASIQKEHSSFQSDGDWQKFITKNIVPRMRMLGVTDSDAEEFNLIVSNVLPGADTAQLETTSRILIRAWWKSADGNEPLSVAMQRMTSKVFTGAKSWDTKNPWNGDTAWNESSKLLENPVFNKVASAFLYSQYENTQDFFKQKGITQVVLTRGLHTTDPDIVKASKNKYTVKQPGYKPSGEIDRGEQEGQVASGEWDKGEWYTGPMSSWTLVSDHAARFALASDAPSYKQPGIPVVIASKIPVERVIGGYWSGYGAFAVDEVVVLGTEHPTDKTNWATFVNTGRARFYGEEKLENIVTKDLAQGTKNVLKSLQQKKGKKPINVDEGYNADWIKTLSKPTMKSMLSYGLEPVWVQNLFKAVKTIKPKVPNVTYNKTQLGGKFSIPKVKSPLHYNAGPESEAEQQSAIGTEGGKFFIDEHGKKHYGPYGPQPIKKPKAVEDQIYLHEQAEPVPPPLLKKPKSLEKEIADFKAKGNGTTTDFVMEYGKTHHDEVVAVMMTGSTFKFTYKLSDKLKEAGYNDIDTDPVVLNNALLYSIPTAERKAIKDRIKFLEETKPDTIYKRVSDATKITINSILASAKSNTETVLLIAELVDRMVGTANSDTGFGLSYEQREELTKKYKAYLTNRIKEAKEMRKNVRIFSHTIQVADSPAKLPIDSSKDPDTWKNSGPEVEKKIREDHPENKTREDWKIMVSKQIGKRMIDLGITTEMANDYFTTINHYPRASTEDIRISAADDMVASWASSADGSNALSLAIQRLTSEVFPGAARWDTIQPWNGKGAWDWSTKYLDNPVFKQVATAFLYAQYENTQDYFKQLGVTQVTIGRGCKTIYETINKQAAEAANKSKEAGSNNWVVSGILDEDKHVTNPLSSWGWDSSTNSNFAGGSGLPSSDQEGQPVVIAATVPVSRVLGGFFSGDGCENEHEVILIGSEKPVDKLYWAAWDDTSGDFDKGRDTAILVAQEILQGGLPTTESMGFITPAMKFRQKLTQELIGSVGENWNKLSDEELEAKIKAVYGINNSKRKTIPLGDGSSIGVRQAITIVHDLMNQGYGLSTSEAVDKLVLNGGLKSLLNSWYTTDEDKWMGKFESVTAKNILQELVKTKVISQEELSSAAAYLNQKVKQQVEEEKKKPLANLADTKLATDLEEHTKNYISNYNTNLLEKSDEEMADLITNIADDYMWTPKNQKASSEAVEKLTKTILDKLNSEAKSNVESLTGPKLDAHIDKLLKNPNIFKTSSLSGKFVSFIDVLTMAEDVTNSLMEEAGLNPFDTPYYKNIKDAVKLRLRKEYKKQLQEAYNKGLPIPPGAEATLGKD